MESPLTGDRNASSEASAPGAPSDAALPTEAGTTTRRARPNRDSGTCPKGKRTGGKFWRQGEPLVWLTAACLGAIMLIALTLIAVVMANGLGVFWPAPLVAVTLEDGAKLLGVEKDSEVNPDTGVRSVRFKTANREFDAKREDFHWLDEAKIVSRACPPGTMVVERAANGDFYGAIDELRAPGLDVPEGGDLVERLSAALAALEAEQARQIAPLDAKIAALSDAFNRAGSAGIKAMFRRKQSAAAGAEDLARLDAEIHELQTRQADLNHQTDEANNQRDAAMTELRRNVAVFLDGEGQRRSVVLADIIRFYQPNTMGPAAKAGHYLTKLWELFTTAPRESNTEGGLFPAILGTVLLVFLMAIGCFPLGVLAGVYLGEYARDGVLVRIVRIGVNNLAGIPSIVYGMFGLGFFIYGIGGALDHVFYPDVVAAKGPVWGTGNVLWASLTLGLLTVPVVIVATEESVRTIPRSVRESSYALGATKFQTLRRVLLPLASPGIMTGFILAMARAAGEVAPLMITGVVKSAPTLPVDGRAPFLHLDRQFMHLGFHIYDVGFQSPNVEASKPMVFVTTLLLVLIVLVMSSAAIYLRNRMRRKLRIRTI